MVRKSITRTGETSLYGAETTSRIVRGGYGGQPSGKLDLPKQVNGIPMERKAFLQDMLDSLNGIHMPTHGITLNKKMWRDGFNAGKDDVFKQIAALMAKETEGDGPTP